MRIEGKIRSDNLFVIGYEITWKFGFDIVCVKDTHTHTNQQQQQQQQQAIGEAGNVKSLG